MVSFAERKQRCLGKVDKSSAGRIDARAVEICGVLNGLDAFYTTSSCAGRCLLWRGVGRKDLSFERFRVNHDLVDDALSYFDVTTIRHDDDDDGHQSPPVEEVDPRDGADLRLDEDEEEGGSPHPPPEQTLPPPPPPPRSMNGDDSSADGTLWLRFEPFILHVCCNGPAAAAQLVAAARAAGFKNVGLQGWREGKHMVAIWGDEGLEMPLTVPGTRGEVPIFAGPEQIEWLKRVVNEKHARNWDRIDRLVAEVRSMEGGDELRAPGGGGISCSSSAEDFVCEHCGLGGDAAAGKKPPRHYDVVGDVAILNSLPEGYTVTNGDDAALDTDALAELGQSIIATNPSKIKICCVRTGALESEVKSSPVRIIAGPNRHPLYTTHREYGVQYCVDVSGAFFTPRMGLERLRICNQVGRGERVCVLFAGIAPEALQVAAKTEAAAVTAIELNPSAVACARRSVALLRGRNRPNRPEAADKITLIEGDAIDVCSTLPRGCFDRVLAPRPKGVVASENGGGDDGGTRFMDALLPTLRSGAECHWYDFAAEGELPACERTRQFVAACCERHGLRCEILYTGLAGKKSIATRQFRVCVDFRVHAEGDDAVQLHGTNVVTERMMASTSKRQLVQERQQQPPPASSGAQGGGGGGGKYACRGCGQPFSSRNAMFRHVHASSECQKTDHDDR